MSEKSSRDLSISKIEKKVLKNTFHTKNNNLQHKLSNISENKSFNNNSRSSQIQNFDTNELSSMISIEYALLSATKEFNLSGIASNVASPYSIQEMARCALPGSTLVLPSGHIVLPSLQICSPITLKGSPGGVLEFSNGGVSVDFSSDQSFILCECSIICESSISNTLFSLKSANVEIRDCVIKSSSLQSSILGEFEEICFLSTGTQKNNILKIFSCNISGFSVVLKDGTNSSIYIEKSHFYGCAEDCISVSNPRELVVTESLIEKCGGSGLDFRVGSKQISQNLHIENSDFLFNAGYGVHIWSKKESSSPLNITCVKSKIQNSGKEGLAVKHVQCSYLDIYSSDFTLNRGTGCWLQKVHSASDILFRFNRSFDSIQGYGVYLYECGAVLDSNEIFRNKLGGVLVAGRNAQEKIQVTMLRNAVYSNRENGINVLDFFNGDVLVEDCRVHDNYGNGFFLLQSQEINKLQSNSKARVLPEENSTAKVVIKRSTVERNKQFGIVNTKFLCFVEKSSVEDNKHGNFSLSEGSDAYLKIDRNEELKASICTHKCSVF